MSTLKTPTLIICPGKRRLKKAYGARYNLVFTTDGSDSDALLTNLFTFSLETADLKGVEGEQVFLTTSDGIQLAKGPGDR